jgi:hypothetical protein
MLCRCLYQVAISLKSQNSHDGDGEKEEGYEGTTMTRKLQFQQNYIIGCENSAY